MDDWVRRDVSVGPEDETRGVYVLRREEGPEHVFLAFTERSEVGAPVDVVLHALLGVDVMVAQIVVVVWRKDGASKSVAIHSHSHWDTGLDLEAFHSIDGVGQVIQGADTLWAEATREGSDGVHFCGYPVAVVEDEVDVEVRLVQVVSDQGKD